ncbi:MAG: hypothetical protein FWH33_03250, partial [Oscillospiraceae bacterium]|nr:hypothetical protein [Oscillospiraceae bacterium]
MDISSLLGGGKPEKENQPAFEYTAQAASAIVNGEAKLTIGENAFTAAALFDTAEVTYATVNAIEYVNYTVAVKTDDGDYAFSRMGQWAQPFYDSLREAYNNAVLRAFFVRGNPILTATGDYRFDENGMVLSGTKAPIQVYENCIAALPPNGNARRIPLCFVVGMEKGDYQLTLKLLTGESYTFSKLGYDTAPFADAVEKQIRALRENSLAAIKELDPGLKASEASQLVNIIREGVAAPMGQIANIAPSFVQTLESTLSQTRADESYATFKELCGSEHIWVGFKKNDIGAGVGVGSLPDIGGGAGVGALANISG